MAKKQKIYDHEWVVKNDEFHPNLRRAATHADENSKAFTARLREKEARRENTETE